MHTLGKVFLWINLLLLIGAVLLTSKLANTRNYWMGQVEQRTKQIRDNDAQIAQKEKELRTLQNTLAAQRAAWDTMIVAGNSRANADGTVIVGVGSGQGFGVVAQGQPAPTVHVFVPQGNGSMYLGPFSVDLTNVAPAQTQLIPLFRVQPNEPANWPAGNWRLWTMVPSQAPSRVVELTNGVVSKLEQLAGRQYTLELQQKEVAQARQHLEGRQQELFGNEQAPKIAESPEVTVGLVAALRDAEAARDADNAELDRLRREVDQAYERLTRLVAQNGRLVQQSSAATPGPALSAAQ
jgi:hypothetical protein